MNTSSLKPSDARRSRGLPQWLSLILKASASGALLYYVVTKINVSEAIQRIAQAKHSSLIIAVSIGATIPAIIAVRWWVLARPLISLGSAITFTWIGLLYGLILPGGVSGDIMKGSIMALRDSRVRQAALPASILTDRIVGFAVMLLFFCASCLLIFMTAPSAELARFALPASGIGALGLAALLAGWTKPVQRLALAALARMPWAGGRARFQQFAEATFSYSKQPGRLLAAAGLSVCGQFLSVALYLALLRALSVHLGAIPSFALYSIFSVLAMAPISFAGIGVRDWFAIGFFKAYGLPAESAVAFAWLCLAMAIVQAATGGLLQLVLIAQRPGPRASGQ